MVGFGGDNFESVSCEDTQSIKLVILLYHIHITRCFVLMDIRL
jgi:hypothetical protein